MAGALLSSTGYALAPYITSMKIPMVYPVVSADDLTQRRRSEWIVRTGWSGSQPNHAFGEYAYHTLGIRSVVTIALDYAFGWESVGGFERTFVAQGGRIEQKIWVPRVRARLRAVSRADSTGRRRGVRAAARPIRAPVHAAIPGVRAEGSREADRRRHDDRRTRAAVHGRRSARHRDGACTTAPRWTRPPTRRSRRPIARDSRRCRATTRRACTRAASGSSRPSTPSTAASRIGGARSTHCDRSSRPTCPRGPVELDAYGNPIENVYIRRVERVNGQLQNTVIDTFPKVSQFWTFDPARYLQRTALCEIARSSRACLQLENVSRHFGGLKAVDDVTLVGAAQGARHARDRSQRRRKDDAVQRHQRRVAADQRDHRAEWGEHHEADAAPARGARHRENISDHQAVSRAHRDRERAARLCGARPAASSRCSGRSRPTPTSPSERPACWTSSGSRASAHERRRHISYGAQRRLDVALSLAGRPRLLLLDEPMAGLSTPERVAMRDLLEQLDPSIAVLLIEHDMDVAFSFAATRHGAPPGQGPRRRIARRGQRERPGPAGVPRCGGREAVGGRQLAVGSRHPDARSRRRPHVLRRQPCAAGRPLCAPNAAR